MNNNMTVKELKELLKDLPDDMEVRVAVYSGPTPVDTVKVETIQVDKYGGEMYENASNAYGPYPYHHKKDVVMISGFETE